MLFASGTQTHKGGGWSLMILFSRATRGLGRPSFGPLARLGVPVGGRVRKLRAVEDQSAPIPEEVTSELGGSIIEPCSQGSWARLGAPRTGG